MTPLLTTSGQRKQTTPPVTSVASKFGERCLRHLLMQLPPLFSTAASAGACLNNQSVPLLWFLPRALTARRGQNVCAQDSVRLLSKEASFFKNPYYHRQQLRGFHSKLHHRSFLDERRLEQFIIALRMRRGNLECLQLMSAPSWDYCNLAAKWYHFFFFNYSLKFLICLQHLKESLWWRFFFVMVELW